MKKNMILVGFTILCIGLVFASAKNSFSDMGEFPSSLYAGKEFRVTDVSGAEFDYKVNENGVSVTLMKGDAKGASRLVIPASVEALGSHFLVTYIRQFAFVTYGGINDSPMKGVKQLVLSDGIVSAGQNCFSGANDLEMIEIPSSLRVIPYMMFANCPNLESVKISSGSRISEIGSFAFDGCVSLESFTIPSEVSLIKEGPWRGCKSLQGLKLQAGNYEFKVYDGVLYSGDRKRLIQYPAGKRVSDYYVRFGTKLIDNSAFYGNEYISKVTLPVSLDSISHIAFNGCRNLTNVIFTDSVKFIGNAAFKGCAQLMSIKLYGNPNYSDYGIENPYNTFDQLTTVDVDFNAPYPKLIEKNGSILDRVWYTVSQLPYFQQMKITNNEEYGFPTYFGKGMITGYGNADPKEDILRFLSTIPQKYLAYEVVDEKGRISRYYVDFSRKQTLYFKGGIQGNDLVVALFNGGNVKKIKIFLKELNQQ